MVGTRRAFLDLAADEVVSAQRSALYSEIQYRHPSRISEVASEYNTHQTRVVIMLSDRRDSLTSQFEQFTRSSVPLRHLPIA